MSASTLLRARRVTALNDAERSENAIHHDDVARRYGFGGGLVPGVTVYAYMSALPAEHWGEAEHQAIVEPLDIAGERERFERLGRP